MTMTQHKFDDFDQPDFGSKLTNLGSALGAAAGLIKGDPRGMMAMAQQTAARQDEELKRAKLVFDAVVGGAKMIKDAPTDLQPKIANRLNKIVQRFDSSVDMNVFVRDPQPA